MTESPTFAGRHIASSAVTGREEGPQAAVRLTFLVAAPFLCAVAWLLQLFWNGRQSLWADEASSVAIARVPLDHLLAADLHDIHPPLYYALLHLWMLGAGDSESAVRTLSAWFGTLAVVMLSAMGRRLAGPTAGLVAGAVAATSPLLVYYGQETRMYTVLAFLSILSAYALLRAVGGAPRWWPVYVLAMAAALWSQLYAALLFGALGVWYVAQGLGDALARRRGALALHRHRAWLVAQVAVVLLFAAWVPVALHQLVTYTSPGHGSPLGWLLDQSALAFGVGLAAVGPDTLPGLPAVHAPNLVAHVLLVPVLLAFALGVLTGRQQRVFLLTWLIVPVIGFVVVDAGQRDFTPRYLMEAFPAFLLLVALGVQWCLRQRHARVPGAVLAVAMAGVSGLALFQTYADPVYARDDNRRVAALIAQGALPGAGTVLDANFVPAFQYYARERWPVVSLPATVPADPVATEQALAAFTAGRPQVWLVLWQDYYTDPSRLVWTWLLQHRYVAAWWDVHGGIKVLRFDALPDHRLTPGAGTLGGSVRLVGAQVSDVGAVGEHALWVDLYWQTIARPAASYRIVVNLLDAAGHVYGAAEAQPADDHLPMSTWQPGDGVHMSLPLTLSTPTPPGHYLLQVAAYDTQPVAVLAADGPAAAGSSIRVPVTLPAPATAAALHSPAAPRTSPPASAAMPVGASFAGVGTLSGYQLVPSQHGESLVLFWHATDATPRALKVFVHALDAQGRPIGTGDSDPAQGTAPTTHWFLGELIWDLHRLQATGAGTVAAYEVGLYDPRTGERVPVRLANGHEPVDRAVRLALPPRLAELS